MKKELLPVKTRILIGFIFGITSAVGMAIFDYFDNKPFSIRQFLFYFIIMGTVMSFINRYKRTKQ